MNFFKAKIRLKGSVQNEVIAAALSVPEILILRKLHGKDAVVNMEPIENQKVKNADERARLHRKYGRGLASMEPPLSVDRLFGTYAPLPKSLDELDPDAIESDDDAEEEKKDKKKTGGRPPKTAKSLEAIM